MERTSVLHQPVLLEESLDLLNPHPGATIVDGTVGLAGHAEAILERLEGRGRLIGMDRDRTALGHARVRLSGKFDNFSLHHENFKNLPLVLRGMGIDQLDGCLLDLGISSMQVDTPERGFSFRKDGPLDMRMDREAAGTAADLVNSLEPDRLVEILRHYGEESRAGAIAKEIVRQRRDTPIRTTRALADLVARVRPRRPGQRTHPATKTFQALRLEVNQELSGLDSLLKDVVDLLAPAGRLVVIAFHSLEDRIVKTVFRRCAGMCVCFRPAQLCTCERLHQGRILTKRPITPSPAEVADNPRARSAKLRAFQKNETSQEQE